MQGLSVGGEYGASATYLSEAAGRKRRGFYSSFQYVTLISGQLLALAVLLPCNSACRRRRSRRGAGASRSRIGAVLAIVVYYIRRRLTETESFENARAAGKPKSSGVNLFRDHPREAFLVMALTAGGTLAFYAYTTYMQKFLVNTSGFSRETASQVMTAALFVFMCLQPLSGALSDRIGRKPVMATFGLLGSGRDGPDLHRARDGRKSLRRLRAGDGRADHRHRLHVDQRGGEGGAVSRPTSARSGSPCPTRLPTPCSAAPPNMSPYG